ncbi:MULTISPECIES: hypothetical protein [unclassified Rhizobium]|uniref:hypothetical protein n=1 Tax=unclassified Rhizobium TaxID=2613769 RepID=UPI0011AB6C98|nr:MULTISPECIES: hypothetical protein [unclassified Rhizobium]
MLTKSDVISLRASIRANPRIELEFKGRLSEILRDYHVQVDNDLLGELVLATQSEIDGSIAVDSLPRPTLPAAEPKPTVDSLPRPTLPAAEPKPTVDSLPRPTLPAVEPKPTVDSLPRPALPPV